MYWILLAIFAGICNGSFTLPMKFTIKWKWENIWGIFGFWGFVVLPIILGLLTVPDLLSIYKEAGSSVLFLVFLFGFLWGIGSIAFGLGIHYLGIGLAFSTIIGMTIAIGSIIPLFLGSVEDLLSTSVLMILIGVIIIIVGVAINGYSAVLRENDLIKAADTNKAEKPVAKRSFLTGSILCLVAGLMSPMLQFAFLYGGKIVDIAVKMNVNETMATNAIWIIALFGGFVVNICYCSFLLQKNRSWNLFKSPGTKRYHCYAIIMGIVWVVTIASYGMAVTNMGKQLGPSIGWAIFMSVGIIWANMLGLLTGEWKGVHRKTIYTMTTGLLVLVLGTGVVGWAQFIGADNM